MKLIKKDTRHFFIYLIKKIKKKNFVVFQYTNKNEFKIYSRTLNDNMYNPNY
jgi:hypothetical protein